MGSRFVRVRVEAFGLFVPSLLVLRLRGFLRVVRRRCAGVRGDEAATEYGGQNPRA
jgi:hypothetical protein